ncbi:MAG: FtsX-like permease family protein [Burkholderiales bacterium]|nr:FtsX-like permease family protein [Burkholderiales bacterium]
MMLNLALRQLRFDPVHAALVALAISTAIAVTLILRGFEEGLYAQSEQVVLDRGGQLILAQAGVSNFLAVRSSLPQLTRQQVESIDGVVSAHPMTGFWVIYGPERNKFPLLLLVYDTLGGPTHLIEGTPIQDGRDAIIDLGLSKRFELKPGDPLVVSDFAFRVAGVTSGSSALFSTFAFVTYDGMIDLFLESEIAPDISTFPLLSFLLVETEPGADLELVRQSIEEEVPAVDALLPGQVAANDVALGKELFGPIMGVLISLSYVIGMLIVGLIVYADVNARLRTFGVLKALGFSVSHIGAGVMFQMLLLGLVAFPLGLVLALGVGAGIEWNMPVYRIHVIDINGLAKTFVGLMLMIIIGGLLPLRLITRTDPMIAFQTE